MRGRQIDIEGESVWGENDRHGELERERQEHYSIEGGTQAGRQIWKEGAQELGRERQGISGMEEEEGGRKL